MTIYNLSEMVCLRYSSPLKSTELTPLIDDSMRQEIAGENDRRGSPDLGILPNSAEFDQISSPGFTPLAASIEGERLQPSPEGVSHQTRSRSSTSQMVGPLGSSKPGAGINGNVTEKEHPSISMDDGNVRQSPEGPPHQSRSRSSASQTVGPLRSSKPGAGANDNVAGEEHSSSVIRPDPGDYALLLRSNSKIDISNEYSSRTSPIR